MHCSKFEEYIDRYIDGELDYELKSEFEEHMTNCERCRESLEFSRDIRNTLHNFQPISVPDDFGEKLNKRLDKELRREKLLSTTIFHIPSRYYGAAACLLLAVVLGFNGFELLTEAPQIEQPVIDTEPTIPTVDEIEEVIVEEPIAEEITEEAAEEAAEEAKTSTKEQTTVTTPSKAPATAKPTAPVKTEEPKKGTNSKDRIIIASSVNPVDVDDDTINKVSERIDYRKSYTLLEEAVENKSIANDATLGDMKNVQVVVAQKKQEDTGAVGNSVIVYKRDADIINSILNKYYTRPCGEFYVMSEAEYQQFLAELKANGINYTKSAQDKTSTNDIMFKLVMA